MHETKHANLLNFLKSFPKLHRIASKRKKKHASNQYCQDIQHPIFNLPQINLPNKFSRKTTFHEIPIKFLVHRSSRNLLSEIRERNSLVENVRHRRDNPQDYNVVGNEARVDCREPSNL